MKRVIIDNSFFDLENPLAAGLISGLKELSKKEFSFNLDDKEKEIDSALGKIFNLENIAFSEGSKNRGNYEKLFFISASKKDEKENVLVVGENSNYKNFYEAVAAIVKTLRKAETSRETKETKIYVNVNLDGSGISEINTGLGFFDHMLNQIARHSNIDLKIICSGDLQVDEHHTVEDVALVLGETISKALGDKRGINRYGFLLPMDDSVAQCAIDLGGRAYLNYKVKHRREKVGEFPTELVEEFFKSIAASLKANIFIKAKGKNEHHKIESIFKSFAKALNEALKFNPRNEEKLPTTKGLL